MNRPSTLREWLTHANPTILQAGPRHSGSKGPSTRNENYPIPVKVRRWTDFSINMVNSIFGGELRTYLDKEIDGLPTIPHIDPAKLTINGEASLESLISCWHQGIVLAALRKTSHPIAQQRLKMVKGEEALLIFDDTNKFKPDWAGTSDVKRQDMDITPNDKRALSNNILPGDSKPSWKWDRAKLDTGPYDTMWPLRQLVGYCVLSCSRYGYLITNEELVIIRVSKHKSKSQKKGRVKKAVAQRPHKCQAEVFKSPAVEYTTIPWEASEESEGLTMNLALWTLHLLAANNGRLQTVSYGRLRGERKVPLTKQSAIPWSEREEAITSGNCISRSFGQRSYHEDDGEDDAEGHPMAIPLAVANRDHRPTKESINAEGAEDTEVDSIDEENQPSGDQPFYSQPGSFNVGQGTTEEPTPKRQRRDSHFHSDAISTITRSARTSGILTGIAEDYSAEQSSGPRRSVRMREKRDTDSGRRAN